MESEPRAFLFSVTILLPFNQKTFLSPLRFDVLRWRKCISFRWGWRYGVALRRRFVRAVKELGLQEIQNKMVQTEDARFLCCAWSRQQIQTFRGNVLCAFGLLHWRFAMDPTSRLSFIWQERHLKTEWNGRLNWRGLCSNIYLPRVWAWIAYLESFFVKVFGFTCSDLCIGGVEPILKS